MLRDIAHTHGAVRLTELHRFTDPAEGAASLALRDGRPEALGFYLDQRRVHVGDLTAMTEDVFSAWQTDRSSGLDAIMLAPTRELVSQLNQRARAHRLAAEPDSNQREASRLAMLADGNPASVGEQVITRTNNRTLRMTRHRLGEERRPVDRPQGHPRRRPDGAAPPQRPHRPAARQLRAGVG